MAILSYRNEVLKAYAELKEDRLEDSYKRIQFLLDQKLDDSFVYYMLGSYYSKTENHPLAILAYEKAISLRENFSEALNNVGGSYRKLGLQEKAQEAFMKAIKVGENKAFQEANPSNWQQLLSDYYANYGSSFVAMHNPDEAIKWLNKALEVRDDNSNAKWNRSLAYLEKGMYKEGFRDYDFGERIHAKRARNYRLDADETPLWSGEKDKTVVVYGEQGIGDELMFATIIPDLARDCKVLIYDAHPRLYKMFRRSFSHIENVHVYGTRKAHDIAWLSSFKVDYKTPIGSIPKHYRNKVSDFPRKPYLEPEPASLIRVLPRFDNLKDKPIIGVSWKGGTKSSGKSERTMPMAQIERLIKEVDAHYVSLQYDVNAQEEVDIFNESTGLTIHHWPLEIKDYELTCAVLSHLSLVVSVPQSVVHLAGVMNVPTIQICPYNSLWQMGPYKEEMPWYDCVKNVWQESAGSWGQAMGDTIKEVREALNLC